MGKSFGVVAQEYGTVKDGFTKSSAPVRWFWEAARVLGKFGPFRKGFQRLYIGYPHFCIYIYIYTYVYVGFRIGDSG